MRLFPNPAHDIVTVELSSAPASCQIVLLDAAGRQLLSRSASGTTCQLSLRSLPAGVYLLRVATPDGIATRRLLVR